MPPATISRAACKAYFPHRCASSGRCAICDWAWRILYRRLPLKQRMREAT